MPVSAVKGDGLYTALDWLACKLGSAQARKALSIPTVAPPNSAPLEGGETFDHGIDYCSRAYSAIKCLFFRTNRGEGGRDSP